MKLTENILQVLKDKKISIEDLNDRYFVKSYDESEIENILKLLNENICSFKEIVDNFKSIGSLHNLLQSKELFNELFENNKLSKDDSRYLLNKISNDIELEKLCENTSLIKHILNEFILDKKLVDKFNRITNEDRWCKKFAIHTLFELIEFYATQYYDENNWYERNELDIDQELIELNNLNKKVYTLNNFDFTKDQKLELIEVLRNSEIARNRLIQFIDNNLEDQYDFENLKNLLVKDSEKKKIKMNF